MKILNDSDFNQIQVDTLNLLEEFSLKVDNYKTIQHPVLIPVKAVFVLIVEKHAVALLRIRDVDTGPETYSTILKLYSIWKNQVDRRTPAERITPDWAQLYKDSIKVTQ